MATQTLPIASLRHLPTYLRSGIAGATMSRRRHPAMTSWRSACLIRTPSRGPSALGIMGLLTSGRDGLHVILRRSIRPWGDPLAQVIGHHPIYALSRAPWPGRRGVTLVLGRQCMQIIYLGNDAAAARETPNLVTRSSTATSTLTTAAVARDGVGGVVDPSPRRVTPR